MRNWGMTSREIVGGNQSPGSHTDAEDTRAVQEFISQRDQDFAALMFALAAFSLPAIIGGFLFTVYFAFFE